MSEITRTGENWRNPRAGWAMPRGQGTALEATPVDSERHERNWHGWTNYTDTSAASPSPATGFVMAVSDYGQPQSDAVEDDRQSTAVTDGSMITTVDRSRGSFTDGLVVPWKVFPAVAGQC